MQVAVSNRLKKTAIALLLVCAGVLVASGIAMMTTDGKVGSAYADSPYCVTYSKAGAKAAKASQLRLAKQIPEMRAELKASANRIGKASYSKLRLKGSQIVITGKSMNMSGKLVKNAKVKLKGSPKFYIGNKKAGKKAFARYLKKGKVAMLDISYDRKIANAYSMKQLKKMLDY